MHVHKVGVLLMEEKERVLTTLKEAISIIENCPEFSLLIPEVGCDLVYALPDAKDEKMVAGLTGRIIKVRGLPKACGEVDFGWSPYMSIVAVSAMKMDKNKRTSISLRQTPDIVTSCQKLGLDIVEITAEAPEEEKHKKCLVPWELKFVGRVPDAIYDHGDIGIAPLVTLFSEDPIELAKLLCKLAGMVKEESEKMFKL